MTSYITSLNQLPQKLKAEITAHLGSTAGMSEIQIVSRYRNVAEWLKSIKLASLPPGYAPPAVHLTVPEFDNLGSPQAGVAPFLVDIMNQLVASEGAWYLGNFAQQLSVLENHLNELARQEAARQLAQRQAEEAARQLAQRQAEEAARLHAQLLAEEAARELARRQAEEAAQMAARRLAEQQALAAAQALAQQKAEEAALQEARVKLEMAAAVEAEAELVESIPSNRAKPEIVFIPGPAAMAEIDRATLVLKRSIDSAVTLYASAIAPHLNRTETSATTAR